MKTIPVTYNICGKEVGRFEIDVLESALYLNMYTSYAAEAYNGEDVVLYESLKARLNDWHELCVHHPNFDDAVKKLIEAAVSNYEQSYDFHERLEYGKMKLESFDYRDEDPDDHKVGYRDSK